MTISYKLRSLFLLQTLLALLLTSLLWPRVAIYWQKLDIAFFKLINQSLLNNHYWQVFWACANHKYADWVEDLCILAFFTVWIQKSPYSLRKIRIAQLLFCILYIAFILFFVNRMLFRDFISIPRPSPSLIVENSVMLSKELPWMKIKDISKTSFPGDHATTALLFAASFSYLAGWRFAIAAWLYAGFLCMPRLITGAHWLSDVIVGSGGITLFFLSIAFCTPLAYSISSYFVRIFNGKQIENN
ncbi:phosphatase PAP2 family protein [Candidatus Rhabdochlamydia porcellionis]|jgi:Kdo2-lipid A phosphotransferase|uniref:Lipid A 1-diphosphate synthase n=1 Tax=Candidatus Rhabdochlamydia porcellionis TaxID=225148 RepID=A0ABX8Z4I9_9BACT|nr:phosphatase PAP2 family protein [Candidatus Rhabdochlamydia porcellionis]QZA58987.1 Lipid A 1-diphosphate synthase [Candidatus Rhabdochlamydia porcellionis]